MNEMEGIDVNREKVEAALKLLGEVQRRRTKIKLACEEKIKRHRAERDERDKGLAEAEAQIIKDLKDYAKLDRPNWGKAKSLKLHFGTIGFRQSTSLRLKWKAERVIAALKGRKLGSCITIKESVNKDVLRTLDPEAIAAVGCALKSSESFFAEPHQEME